METQQETVPAAEVAAPSPRPWAIHTSSLAQQTQTVTPKLEAPWQYFEQDVCDDHGRILATVGMWTAGKRGGWPRVDTEAETRANIDYVLRAVNSFDGLTSLIVDLRDSLERGLLMNRLGLLARINKALSDAGIGEELS